MFYTDVAGKRFMYVSYVSGEQELRG